VVAEKLHLDRSPSQITGRLRTSPFERDLLRVAGNNHIAKLVEMHEARSGNATLVVYDFKLLIAVAFAISKDSRCR
jgi:hypothetical protein